MSTTVQEQGGAQHAITDLYDEERNTFLVQYPPRLVIFLALSGVLAFALTGFAGYTTRTVLRRLEDGSPSAYYYPYDNIFDKLFGDPWPLFFWFCALIIVLQWSIFRDNSLRRQRIQSISATLISIAIVIIAYYFRDYLANIGTLFNNLVIAITGLNIGGGLILALLNYGILLIFWVDSIRRWIRRSQNKPIAPSFDLGLRLNRNNPPLIPSLSELISGDLIAGGALSAVLWVLFLPQTMKSIALFLVSINNPNITSVSQPVCTGDCYLADRTQVFIYITFGLLTLALTAVVNGLAAMNAVNNQTVPASGVTSDDPSATGTEKGTKGVVQTLVETLLSAITRQGLNVISNLALALRTAAWPFLVLASVIGAALCSRYIQFYLHGISCNHQANQLLNCDYYGYYQHNIGYLAYNGSIAAAGGAVAILGVMFASGLLIYQWRVIDNTGRFLQLTGLILLLTFWIFALALSSFNALLRAIFPDGSIRFPFYPGPAIAVSFLALVAYAVIFFVQRSRRGDTSPAFVPQVGLRTFRKQQEANSNAGTQTTAVSQPNVVPTASELKAPTTAPMTQPPVSEE